MLKKINARIEFIDIENLLCHEMPQFCHLYLTLEHNACGSRDYRFGVGDSLMGA